MTKTIPLLLMVCLLSACQSNPAKINQINGQVVKPAPRTQPVDAMVPCAKPAALDDKSFGAVVRKLSETIGLLDECASKQQQEADWIKADPQYNPAKPPKK